MDYFDGLSFNLAGRSKQCLSTRRKESLFYGIQYIHSGSMFLRVNHGPVFRLKGPHVFITHPGAYIERGPLSGQIRDHSWIRFHGPRVEKYLKSGLLPLNDEKPAIKINHPEKFQSRLLELIAAINSESSNTNRTTLMLEDLLLQLHEQTPLHGSLPNWRAPLFLSLLERLEKNPAKKWDFILEAKKMGLSPSHFRRLFRRTKGMPPQQYLIHRRLKMVAEMLINSYDSIGLIAEKTGFENGYYLSRMFKQKFAVSPLEYRQEFLCKM